MTTVTLTPNEDVVISGGSYTQLIDGNDASYTLVVRTFEALYGLTSATLPDGARTHSARINARTGSLGAGAPIVGTDAEPINFILSLRDTAGTAHATWTMTVAGPAVADRVTATAPVTVDQTQLDGLRFGSIHTHPPHASGPEYIGKIAEASVTLVYAAIPVVTVTAPTGPIVTSTPTLTWSFTGDPDADAGGIQQRYHARVFTAAQYAAGGFDPVTSTAYYDSGEQVTNATSVVIGPLSDGITFKAYVRAAQNINGQPHWSLWDDGPEFTTNTDPPHVATIVAASSSSSALGRSGQYRRPSQYPTQYEYLDTTAGIVSTPDPGPVPPEFTFVTKFRYDSLPADGTNQALVSQGVGGTLAWRVSFYNANLYVQVSEDSWTARPTNPCATLAALQAAGMVPDADVWLAGTIDFDAAGHLSVRAHVSVDGDNWTAVAPFTSDEATPVTAVFDTTAPVALGVGLDARIYSAEARTGLEPDGPRYLTPKLPPAAIHVKTADPHPGPLGNFTVTTRLRFRDVAGPEAVHQIVGQAGSWNFWNYTGFLLFNFTPVGGTGTDYYMLDVAATDAAFDDNTDIYVGFTVDLDDGAGKMKATPITSTDGETWSPIPGGPPGWAGIPAAVTGIADATGDLIIGTNPTDGVGFPLDGRIYWVEMRTGLDPNAGNLLWRYDSDEAPTDPTPTTWTDPRGRTWTCATPHAISGRTLWRFDASEYPGTGTSYTDPRGRVWTLSNASTIVAEGAVKITVTRDVAHRDWTHVNVERSAVDRLSWEPVRGALELEAPDDVVVAHDYEQPDGVNLWYRARGIIKSGAAIISQGPWLVTGQPVIWTPDDCGEYLRAPGDPFAAVMIEVVADENENATEHRVGLLNVIGRASPVTVWDVPSLPAGRLAVVTRTYDDGVALQNLIRTAPVLLWQGRRLWGHPYRWLVVTGHTVSRRPTADLAFADYREWEIAYVEVEPPTVTS